MLIKNSIKQMFRTPVRTFLFLFLITVSAIFLSVGGNLWVKNQTNMKNYEDTFVTIGTVKQKPSSIKQETIWNAQKKDYEINQYPTYAKIYPITTLSFEGANYIQQPEKRSYYGSYAPEYQLQNENGTFDQIYLVAEISPKEDCVPNESVQIDVKKVLGGNKYLEGSVVWFCNHTQKNPAILYKDKTYVVCITQGAWTHGDKYESINGTQERDLEYTPFLPIPMQYAGDGTQIENSLKESFGEDSPLYFELKDGFYETDLGKHYLNLVQGSAMFSETFPVTGTNSTTLLMPFYNSDAFISEGRDISKKEYEEGAKVCLVSKKFAQNNNLKIGDFVHTQLYYTNCKNPACRNFMKNGCGINFSLLDAKGKAPEVFEDGQYSIVGVYEVAPGAESLDYNVGTNELIVPINSVKNRDNNIFAYGPMTGSTTSFQIPNGTIDSFMKEWDKSGIEDLEITFYDRGYSILENGIENMKYMSFILLAVGIGMSISLLFLYSHLLITNQKQRAAIERSLGVSKKQCGQSLLFSILLVLFVGSILGSAIGGMLSRNIGATDVNQIYYDTAYSNVADVEIGSDNVEENSNQSLTLIISLSCACFIILTGVIISISKIRRSLSCEPMKQLSERELK